MFSNMLIAPALAPFPVLLPNIPPLLAVGAHIGLGNGFTRCA